MIALPDEQWALVADPFDPPGRLGAPVRPRRRVVDAMLCIARSGIQWRRRSKRNGASTAVRARSRGRRASGVAETQTVRGARRQGCSSLVDPVPML